VNASGGTAILSGLIASDAPEIVATYLALLGGRSLAARSLGDWRALSW
jgi:hypothetical protein